jgi:hypothetical protein
MTTLEDYARQSVYSDPGEYGSLLDAAGADIAAISEVAQNVIVHYRAAGITFEGARLAEVDSRWLRQILAVDQSRFPMPLERPRPLAERVAGCCRDFTLFAVGALRRHGVPARSRAGFAPYFSESGYHYDHVVVQWWDGSRWVMTDAEIGRLDVDDFETAAQVWTALRRGEIDDPMQYGVAPGLPLAGEWFIYNYVFIELAHRQRDESLLWDDWGAMAGKIEGADLALADEIAGLLLEADAGSASAERELTSRYASDPRLRLTGMIRSHSPTGELLHVDLS